MYNLVNSFAMPRLDIERIFVRWYNQYKYLIFIEKSIFFRNRRFTMNIIITEIILVILIGIYSILTWYFFGKGNLLFLNFLSQKIFRQCLLHILMAKGIQRKY